MNGDLSPESAHNHMTDQVLDPIDYGEQPIWFPLSSAPDPDRAFTCAISPVLNHPSSVRLSLVSSGCLKYLSPSVLTPHRLHVPLENVWPSQPELPLRRGIC